jgi:hypothetical protein
MKQITVFFNDGSKHIYSGVPPEVTSDQVTQRAQKEFANKQIGHLDRTDNGVDSTYQFTPQKSTAKSVVDALGPAGYVLEQTAKNAAIVPETAASMATGLASSAVGGVRGVVKTVKGLTEGKTFEQAASEGADAVKATQEAGTYLPRTERAKAVVGALGKVAEMSEKPAEYVGDKTLAATGSAGAATTAHIATQAVTDAVLSAIGIGGVRGVKAAQKALPGVLDKAAVNAGGYEKLAARMEKSVDAMDVTPAVKEQIKTFAQKVRTAETADDIYASIKEASTKAADLATKKANAADKRAETIRSKKLEAALENATDPAEIQSILQKSFVATEQKPSKAIENAAKERTQVVEGLTGAMQKAREESGKSSVLGSVISTTADSLANKSVIGGITGKVLDKMLPDAAKPYKDLLKLGSALTHIGAMPITGMIDAGQALGRGLKSGYKDAKDVWSEKRLADGLSNDNLDKFAVRAKEYEAIKARKADEQQLMQINRAEELVRAKATSKNEQSLKTAIGKDVLTDANADTASFIRNFERLYMPEDNMAITNQIKAALFSEVMNGPVNVNEAIKIALETMKSTNPVRDRKVATAKRVTKDVSKKAAAYGLGSMGLTAAALREDE